MFSRLLALLLLVLLGALLASWLGAQPGMLQFEWLGWQIEMRTSLAVAILGVSALALILLDRFLRGFFICRPGSGATLPDAGPSLAIAR